MFDKLLPEHNRVNRLIEHNNEVFEGAANSFFLALDIEYYIQYVIHSVCYIYGNSVNISEEKLSIEKKITLTLDSICVVRRLIDDIVWEMDHGYFSSWNFYEFILTWKAQIYNDYTYSHPMHHMRVAVQILDRLYDTKYEGRTKQESIKYFTEKMIAYSELDNSIDTLKSWVEIHLNKFNEFFEKHHSFFVDKIKKYENIIIKEESRIRNEMMYNSNRSKYITNLDTFSFLRMIELNIDKYILEAFEIPDMAIANNYDKKKEFYRCIEKILTAKVANNNQFKNPIFENFHLDGQEYPIYRGSLKLALNDYANSYDAFAENGYRVLKNEIS